MAAAAIGLAAQRPVFGQSADIAIPVTGDFHPDLTPFDRLMVSFLEEHRVPGASLAIVRHGKLVYARGFGYADIEAQKPVQPTAMFRIASVSKPITAVAVLQLVEQGRLELDERVIVHLSDSGGPASATARDPRWNCVTVRQCLQHTAGWDREQSGDPIGRPWEIAGDLEIRPPVTPTHIVRYMLGRPLDFEPGERFVYSNFGYLVLGRVIEAVTGESYETHVKKAVLAPIGIQGMQLGRALRENRARGEVRYYDSKNRTAPALYPPQVGQRVSIQYGGENFEAYEAHGGWMASAIDLVRFAATFDHAHRCPILGTKMIAQMWARPSGAVGADADGRLKATYYGCGWSVRPVGDAGKCNAWHTGRIAGTSAILVRRWDGLNWVALFNTDSGQDGQAPAAMIDPLLHEAAAKVAHWPEVDRFGDFV